MMKWILMVDIGLGTGILWYTLGRKVNGFGERTHFLVCQSQVREDGKWNQRECLIICDRTIVNDLIRVNIVLRTLLLLANVSVRSRTALNVPAGQPSIPK
jgi:hypothetical protein